MSARAFPASSWLRLLAVTALAGLAMNGPARAEGSDCASAEVELRARGAPVCSPPSALSPAQEATCAEHARWASIVADCRRAAERDNRRWLSRFPDETAHRSAERAEIDSVVVKLRGTNARLAELLGVHKMLREKAEFYPTALPRDLQLDLEANTASLLAVRDLFARLEAELAGIVEKFADERAHLRKLWSGASPGAVGVFVPRSVVPSVARAVPHGRT